jgi:amidase
VDLFFKWQELLVDEGRYGAEQRYIAGRRLHQYRLEMSQFLSKYDIVLCPPDANVATKYHDGIDHYPPIEETYKIVVEGGSYTQAFNITGSPVACVPISQSEDSMPVGVQVASAIGRDSLVLQAAQLLEERFGGWQMPKAI